MVALLVVGGGEHARVVMEAARTREELELVGFVDPKPCARTVQQLRVAHLGGDDAIREHVARGGKLALGVGAVGVSRHRRALVERLSFGDDVWPPIVHASAIVSPSAMLGAGAVVMASATIGPAAQVGRFCVVNTGAIVEHDVELGPWSQVGPKAALGGGVCVGEEAYVGLGASVRDHITVGPRSLVALGAAVVRDVAPNTQVRGVPARAYAPSTPSD